MGPTSKIVIALSLIFLVPMKVEAKKKHPFDLYDHEMHIAIFESVPVACETCHADPDSYGDRNKVNKQGCHLCHNSPEPILDVKKPCVTCHLDGPPKPKSHRLDWKGRHQLFAKQNPKECETCHTNKRFCIDCHSRRDTVQERMHRRNFRFFHSIEARANPRKCDACHTITYCQECHSGRGGSKR
ncbi:MAG: hypothetical protein HYY44_02830 [Deltaproteobacteria bacterium]|nr:hypothetical protein [Deltaproteobacteria bacterium]